MPHETGRYGADESVRLDDGRVIPVWRSYLLPGGHRRAWRASRDDGPRWEAHRQWTSVIEARKNSALRLPQAGQNLTGRVTQVTAIRRGWIAASLSTAGAPTVPKGKPVR